MRWCMMLCVPLCCTSAMAGGYYYPRTYQPTYHYQPQPIHVETYARPKVRIDEQLTIINRHIGLDVERDEPRLEDAILQKELQKVLDAIEIGDTTPQLLPQFQFQNNIPPYKARIITSEQRVVQQTVSRQLLAPINQKLVIRNGQVLLNEYRPAYRNTGAGHSAGY